jgi:glycine hydroxymethyltransferase
MPITDSFFPRDLADADPQVRGLVADEESRQASKLIMIPSESCAPASVRAALATVFTNIYAEGYPAQRSLQGDPRLLADVDYQLAYHLRYADRRFYKGTEFVNVLEALAQRRVADLFANPLAPSDEIFANVQALSGAAANNAAYEALVTLGDPVMGMDLTHGGHLTHGSPYNRSGKYHRVFPYGVNPSTGRLDYAAIAKMADEVKPRLIVAGASAYPWTIDWQALRAVAERVGAFLLADISHPAGLVVAGLFPNPVGLAHVTTFTTHKTMIGPRAAVILTTDAEIASRINRAIFPGEQGGPHVNNIAAMAVAFQNASTPTFRHLQERTVANAKALAKGLADRGLRLAYGGTDTHMLLVDLNGIDTHGAFAVKGDVASRILDICGLVCNKNTIPGDLNAAHSSALRFGTTWVSQQGLESSDMREIANTVADLLLGLQTFCYIGNNGDVGRAKLPLSDLRKAKVRFGALVRKASGMPADPGLLPPATEFSSSLLVEGERAAAFLHECCSANILALTPGQSIGARFFNETGTVVDDAAVLRLPTDELGRERFLVVGRHPRDLAAWLVALSEGYVVFDHDDIFRKVQGPVVVRDGADAVPSFVVPSLPALGEPVIDMAKPYFVGQAHARAAGLSALRPQPALSLKEAIKAPDLPLRRTPLYAEHVRLKGKVVPFAGWEMPVWYTSVSDEHAAVRQAAGLFDVAHMGTVEISGPGATRFLDMITTNYVPALPAGHSQYAYLLAPDGAVLDDILIYRRERERYLLVLNASNAEKDLAWLQAVNAASVELDRDNPAMRVEQRVTIRSLKEGGSGPDQRVDLALQGPLAMEIAVRCLTPEDARQLFRLRRGEFMEGAAGRIPVLISRTGYTGEEHGLEFYVHPDQATALWSLLMERGAELGIRPCGLGARDSTRTEAGLPLFGHELAGDHDINPIEAGYGPFVKLHKPFFVGRSAMVLAATHRQRQIIRFEMKEKGIRAVRGGFPVVGARGEYAGVVTSCTLVDGVQTGMALVQSAYVQEGTPLAIFPMPREGKAPAEKSKSELGPGDRVLLADQATVVSRFPLRHPHAG